MSLDVCCLCLCFHVSGGCGCWSLREHLGVGYECMYVGSFCDVVYRSCDVGLPSTEFPPSSSFLYPLPHKPFLKRNLLKANCERDIREIACTVSSAGGRTIRNWASGYLHVRNALPVLHLFSTFHLNVHLLCRTRITFIKRL